MTDLIHQDGDVSYTRLSQGVTATLRNSRCRFGQLRAPKRSIIENKLGPHRVRRNPRVDAIPPNTISDHSYSSKADSLQDSSIPVRNSFSSFDSSSRETHPPSSQSAALTENKRRRPELHVPRLNIASSAPESCMRNENSSPLSFGSKLCAPTKDQVKHFTCKGSLMDENRLRTILSKESQYHPNNAFLYYVNPDVEDKVDAVLRNEAVHNLRFIHNTFFNLSTETFCKAVNLIDRFIVKVKVKPKYMACVATASYCVASKICYMNKKVELPAPETLVQITRCGGNSADLLRMEEILASKLSHDLDGVNTFDFLRLFADALVPLVSTDDYSKQHLGPVHLSEDSSQASAQTQPIPCDRASSLAKSDKYSEDIELLRTQLIKRLMTRLEIVLCSLEAYRFRPACLALGILVQVGVKDIVSIANRCEVDWDDVINCATLVEELYEVYYRDPLPCNRRPLVWNLSRRTLYRIGYSSPTPLDTIMEDCEPADEEEWLLPLLFEP